MNTANKNSFTKIDWNLINEFNGDITRAFVYQRIKDLPNNKKYGKADFSILRTANETGMTRGKIQRAINYLVENGYLIKHGKTWNNKTVYSISDVLYQNDTTEELEQSDLYQNDTTDLLQNDTTDLYQNDTSVLSQNDTTQSVDNTINKTINKSIDKEEEVKDEYSFTFGDFKYKSEDEYIKSTKGYNIDRIHIGNKDF